MNDLDSRRWGWWGFVFTAAFVASPYGRPWGLTRHWWIVAKLILTLAAAALSIFARPVGPDSPLTSRRRLLTTSDTVMIIQGRGDQ